MTDLDERIGRVFRSLATEHAETRPVDADALFARIQGRLGADGGDAGAFGGAAPNSAADGAAGRRPPSDRPQLALVPPVGSRPERGAIAAARANARRLAGASATLVAAAMALAVFWPGERKLGYEVVGPVASSRTGEGELLATESGPAEVRFSDESVVELGPSTTLRLQTLKGDSSGPEKVTSRLSHGRLSVEVKHREGTDYRFFAGRYEVRVVGTSFDLSYEPREERLDLAMRTGRVEVLDGSGKVRVVSAGERLVLPPTPESTMATEAGRAHESADVPHTEATSADGPGGPSGEPDARNQGGQLSGGARAVATAGGTTTAGSQDFRTLAADGRFAEIVRLARAEGIDRALGTRSARDLQELAHAARYTGNGALAGRAWKVLIERFGGEAAGRNARFFLARLDEDEGRKKDALRGYEAYLVSGGVYGAEALGRRLLLTRDVHGDRAARPLAKEYLAKLPGGAYAKTAQQLVEGE